MAVLDLVCTVVVVLLLLLLLVEATYPYVIYWNCCMKRIDRFLEVILLFLSTDSVNLPEVKFL